LLETWENLEVIVQEANYLLQLYITSPPEGKIKEKGEKVLDWFEKNEGSGQQEKDDDGKGENQRSLRQIHSDDRQQRRSPSAKSPSRQSIDTLVKKSLAEDVLKSVPQFNGGHEQFIDWAQAAQTLIDIKYFSATAAFELLKKTLEGKPKKLVETMSLQEPELLETMMKKLKKEYGDARRVAVLQRNKIADHKVVSYGADHLQEFYDLVNGTHKILKKTGRVGDEREFIGLVLTRLPRTYQNCLDPGERKRVASRGSWSRKAAKERRKEKEREEG
jgi:hypothetical protein